MTETSGCCIKRKLLFFDLDIEVDSVTHDLVPGFGVLLQFSSLVTMGWWSSSHANPLLAVFHRFCLCDSRPTSLANARTRPLFRTFRLHQNVDISLGMFWIYSDEFLNILRRISHVPASYYEDSVVTISMGRIVFRRDVLRDALRKDQASSDVWPWNDQPKMPCLECGSFPFFLLPFYQKGVTAKCLFRKCCTSFRCTSTVHQTKAKFSFVQAFV